VGFRVRVLDFNINGREAAPQHFTNWGQPHLATCAVEQPPADAGFQCPDYLTHPRIGDAESLGGMAEMQLVGEGKKYPDFSKLEHGQNR
jgi:hypothetical protein